MEIIYHTQAKENLPFFQYLEDKELRNSLSNKYEFKTFSEEAIRKIKAARAKMIFSKESLLKRSISVKRAYNEINNKKDLLSMVTGFNSKSFCKCNRKKTRFHHRSDCFGENNPMFGRDRSGYRNPMYGKRHSEESKLKISRSELGDRNHNWSGGKSFEPYNLHFNESFKNLIKLRDNFCCLNCGISEQKHVILIGRKLSIHHIDYNKHNTCLMNCCTLCNHCNIKANKNRIHWRNLFESKLNDLYNYDYILINQKEVTEHERNFRQKEKEDE